MAHSILERIHPRTPPNVPRYLLIAVGGAAGAMARYAVGAWAAQRFGPRFPVGTFLINLSACFLIGLVVEYLNRHTGLSAAWRFLIPTGFIGAYSTFSTFELEAWTDCSRGAYAIGMAYVLASLVGGFLLVALGAAVGRALR